MPGIILLAAAATLCGQELISNTRAVVKTITLAEAVAAASKNYPTVKMTREQAQAAAARIQLARTAFLPKIDGIAGVNRATRNNTFGLLLPSQIIAPISGPALNTNSMSSVFGSTIGVLVNWEPFDFGLRQATVDIAAAGKRRADLAVARNEFELSLLAADSYLTLLAAEETVKAAGAAYVRAQNVEHLVEAVVKAELRPGGDLTRAQAESAAAMNLLIQTEQARDLAKVALAQLVGETVGAAPGEMLAKSPRLVFERVALDQNPKAREQQGAIDEVKAREKALDKSYYPKFSVQGTSYARGEGAYEPLRGPGNAGNAVSGLGPNIQNWAVGFTVAFPLFDLPAIKARKEAELHQEKAEQAKYEQVLRELNGQLDRARAHLLAAQRFATNMPPQLKAARESKEQVLARYQAGLATMMEVADAERLLVQTEIDAGLVNLNTWRAVLMEAGAVGDLEPFLKLVR